jgi:hypothetical protein
MPAPNPGASIPAWNSPVGFSLDWYENTSSAPVTIESVSLIDPHNLVLRGAVIYQGTSRKHSVDLSDGWKLMGRYADPNAWAHRQGVPGAVIPAQTSQKGTTATDPPEYDVILDISAKTPAGGYASGQQVTYKQGNNQYTIRTYSGYAISPPEPNGDTRCHAMLNAVETAWPTT